MLLIWLISICVIEFVIANNNISSCVWKPSYGHTFPEVYYINLASSIERNKLTQDHLQALHVPKIHRINALTMKNIHIPNEVLDNLPINLEDKEIPAKNDTNFWNELINITHVLTGLDMRKNNEISKLAVTISHLEAIRKAIFENTTDNPYALILEDDVFFPFNLNMTSLIESAPKDFGFLQVFNSEHHTLRTTLRNYYIHRKINWVEKHPEGRAGFWGACAYLINRDILRPVIQQIIYKYSLTDKYHVKIIPGYREPCGPKIDICCQYNETTNKYIFTNTLPCVNSPRGYYSDSYLYALAKTYVVTVPIITNYNQTSDRSTIHQDHVHGFHDRAFLYQHDLMNQIISGELEKPIFVDFACKSV